MPQVGFEPATHGLKVRCATGANGNAPGIRTQLSGFRDQRPEPLDDRVIMRTISHLHIYYSIKSKRKQIWCPRRDSNPQNSDFESDMYANSITRANGMLSIRIHRT